MSGKTKLTPEERAAKAEFKALCHRVVKELAPAAKASAKTNLVAQYEREWLEELRRRRENEKAREAKARAKKKAALETQRERKRERDRRYRMRKRQRRLAEEMAQYVPSIRAAESAERMAA